MGIIFKFIIRFTVKKISPMEVDTKQNDDNMTDESPLSKNLTPEEQAATEKMNAQYQQIITEQ